MSYLAQLDILPAKELITFRKTGRSEIIPAEIQDYIRQLDTVIQIKKTDKFHNVTRLAEKLMVTYPELSIHNAKKRVYDALAFFHVHDPVSNEVWDEIYAEKMDDIGQMCLTTGKLESAIKAFSLAHEYRTKENTEIRPEDLKPPIFIISNTITPRDLGFESNNLKNIARKDLEGHYIKLIDALDIDDFEKGKLKRDAGLQIEDAEIIEEDDNGRTAD